MMRHGRRHSVKNKRLASIQQPIKFRDRELVPKWVHFPRLRLLLGWGPGLRETLGSSVSGLRDVIIPENAGIIRPPLKWLMTKYDEHYLFNTRLCEIAPQLSIIGVGAQCHSYRLDDTGLVKVDLNIPKNGHFSIVSDPEYAVRYANDEQGVVLTVLRRTRHLKKKYQVQMKQLGLAYASGTGKWSKNPDSQRTPNEQRFAEFLSAVKREYIEKRVRDLEKEPRLRPPDFDGRCKARVRSRLGEIQRGKRDADGKNKHPYTEEALIRGTCIEIARREATDATYDFAWVDERSLTPTGFILPKTP